MYTYSIIFVRNSDKNIFQYASSGFNACGHYIYNKNCNYYTTADKYYTRVITNDINMTKNSAKSVTRGSMRRNDDIDQLL